MSQILALGENIQYAISIKRILHLEIGAIEREREIYVAFHGDLIDAQQQVEFSHGGPSSSS
jgi:hypothetical protein